jgi:two-component system cell cycle response regulator
MRCLVVTGDSVTAFMAEQAAAQIGCQSRVVADPAEALEAALDDGGTHVVIIDHAPPQSDAIAWCAALRRRADGPVPRVILLAAPDDPFDLRRVTDAGIDDLLVRPFRAIELELRLQASLRIVELQTQIEAGNRAFRAAATHDLLTGVLNTAAIRETLRQECDRAGRDRTPLAAILVDVDGLDSIRDWAGTEAADAVLVDVAARIRGNLRPYDSLGRSGGGFLAGLPRCDVALAVTVAQRIQTAVAAAPARGAARAVSITASIGVAGLEAADAGRPDRLEAAAASALASARAAGGNRVATPPDGPLPAR